MFTELKKLDDKKVQRESVSSLPVLSEKPKKNVSPAIETVVDRPVRVWRRRQAFDVYEDQYQSLKELAEKERAQGLPGSMSKMVRDALDRYIKDLSSK